MDAMPIDFSEELNAWSSQLTSSKEMLNILEKNCLNFLKVEQLLAVVSMHINSLQNILRKRCQSYLE